MFCGNVLGWFIEFMKVIWFALWCVNFFNNDNDYTATVTWISVFDPGSWTVQSLFSKKKKKKNGWEMFLLKEREREKQFCKRAKSSVNCDGLLIRLAPEAVRVTGSIVIKWQVVSPSVYIMISVLKCNLSELSAWTQPRSGVHRGSAYFNTTCYRVPWYCPPIRQSHACFPNQQHKCTHTHTCTHNHSHKHMDSGVRKSKKILFSIFLI